MSAFARITVVETRLFLRDITVIVFALLFPTALLVVLGSIPGLRSPDVKFGGARFVDVFAPSLIVIILALLSLNKLPTVIAGYRERGILRRLSTTPVSPALLLGAHLVINLVAGVAAAGVMIGVGVAVFGIAVPNHPLAFALTFLLGLSSLSALGMLVAALAPTARAAGGLAWVLFVLVMFVGGVYVPRFVLPHFLVVLGNYVPPGVQALQDAWLGAAPSPLYLAIMAAITLVAGALAARVFRWE